MSRTAWLRCPISSPRWLKSGISGRDFIAVADTVGGVGEAAERRGDGAGEQDREEDGDGGGDDEDADDRQPLGVDDGVDVAGLGRQEQRAVDRAVALDRHRDRDDQLAALGDADDAPRQRRRGR